MGVERAWWGGTNLALKIRRLPRGWDLLHSELTTLATVYLYDYSPSCLPLQLGNAIRAGTESVLLITLSPTPWHTAWHTVDAH